MESTRLRIMGRQYKLIVITSDARNAKIISEGISSGALFMVEVFSEDQLEHSINDLLSSPFHALVMSESLCKEGEHLKKLINAGKNVPVLMITEPKFEIECTEHRSTLNILESRFTDLAERLSLTNALQQRDGDMLHIIEKSADSILIFDEDGIILFMNPEARELFGNNLDVGEDFGYPVVTGETTEIDLINRKGDRLVAEMRVTALDWAGDEACLAMLRDITERKLTEEMLEQKVEERTAALESATAQLMQMYKVSEQAVTLRSQFIANVSHEIRTPLSGIVTGAELLCDSPDAETAAELGPVIFNSAKCLLDLVNEILDFAKIERGEFTLNETEFSVPELLESVIKQMHSFAEQRHLKLSSNIPEDLPAKHFGDIVKLRQVLLNLVHNALKFTNDGAVIITLKQTSDMVQFIIKDSGVGIDQKDLALIFQPFVQAGGVRMKQTQGTGLGLSICSQLAKAMNGSITCTSTMGQGSVFTLELPLRRIEPNKKVS